MRCIGNALLVGARRGFIPKGLACLLAGVAASLLFGFGADDPPMPTCYAPPAPRQPMVIKSSVMPNTTGGAGKMTVSALVVNYERQAVTGARFCVMAPAIGDQDLSFDLLPADGAFDSDSEEVRGEIDLSGMAPGAYSFYIAGYSESGEGERYLGRLEVTGEQ
jgi:hypothetical protein